LVLAASREPDRYRKLFWRRLNCFGLDQHRTRAGDGKVEPLRECRSISSLEISGSLYARRRQAEIKVDDKGEPTGETELVHTGKEGGWLPHMVGKNNPSFAAVVGWVMPLDDSVAQR
jgi:hypothetical protein